MPRQIAVIGKREITAATLATFTAISKVTGVLRGPIAFQVYSHHFAVATRKPRMTKSAPAARLGHC